MSERSNGRSNGSLGTAVPASDAPFDGLAQLIDSIVQQRLAAMTPRLAEVTRVPTNDARVTVRYWDDEGVGQELMARSAGAVYNVGDTVVALPLGPHEVVVLGPIISATSQKAVIGDEEVRQHAIDGERHVKPDSIGYTRLRRSGAKHERAVGRDAIQSGAVSPAELDRSYATPGDVNSAVSNRATTNYVDQQINTRQPAGNYPTTGQMNQALDGKANTNHRHTVDEVRNPQTGSDLGLIFNEVTAAMKCLNNNSGRKRRRPCTGRINRIG